MIYKYLKILKFYIRNYLSLKTIIFSFFEYLIYFVVFYIIFNNFKFLENYSNNEILLTSLSFLLITSIFKFFYKNIKILRYLLITGNFDLILTKPLNSLFRCLMLDQNFSDFVVLVPALITLLYFGSFKFLFLLISGLLIALSIFTMTAALQVLSNGKYEVEKILIFIFLIGYLGSVTLISSLFSLLFAVAILFFALKFWNFAIRKYTNTIY